MSVVALLVILSIVLQSFSFLSLKYASMAHGGAMIALLVIAGAFLVARALVWTNALGRADLSRVYPFTALFQVLIFVYAIALFHETVHLSDLFGLGLMVCGLVLIARERA